MKVIDKFVFVHILKCAGTTLRHSLFEKKFKGRYLYDSTFKHKLNILVDNPEHPVIIEPQQYPDDYEKYDILFGHFNYKKYKHLNRPMFSFVRHPVDRIIDQYFYHKKFYTDRGNNMSLIEFSGIWKNHMSNVLGNIDRYEYIGIVENLEKSLNKMCDIIGISHVEKLTTRRFATPTKIDEKIKNNIAEINSKDMELYENIIVKS